MASKKIEVYDTVLRDGSQSEGVNFSVDDKLGILGALDDIGFAYVEGGWPGSNPRDIEFFRRASKLRLKKARLTAFGSTRRKGTRADADPNLRAIVESGVGYATIFGKSWDLHVRDALRIPLEENLELVRDSVRFLKKHMDGVIYDAEHFFDGYRYNKGYALETLLAAEQAGADRIVLCDTNGGTLPWELEAIIEDVKHSIEAGRLGIHLHNDTDAAVTGTLLAVRHGVRHIQGTINGYGERCGNANLCSIIPALELKMGYDVLGANLRRLRQVSILVDELANLPPNKYLPYVGDSAFAHKAGVHVSAIVKNPKTYEHVEPALVGNRRRVLVSDLSGKANILMKSDELGMGLERAAFVAGFRRGFKNRLNQYASDIVKTVKELENKGYEYEGAEASFELLINKFLKRHKNFFKLVGFRVIDEKRKEDEPPIAEATIMLEVDGRLEHTAAMGNGPVNALDNALRKALEKFYPELRDLKLLDFKVRVISSGEGTGASVRVLIESGDDTNRWSTVGVSPNIIEASWLALVDSINYKLLKYKKSQE
ncbi:MAG: citramalate synthase [Deltaproteobacteria bacterium]|nr:citramalate synthase [Deltaproteobacteria bacterium]MCL5277480.1 citramalate synthase [Deltaproteobacteria bacterium]